MRILLEFDDFIDEASLSEEQQSMIRAFVKKYEKYFNFHDSAKFEESIGQIADDIMSKLSISTSLKDAVEEYITSLHTLSDGISVVMTPDPHLIYRKNPDMVQTIVG